MANRHKPLSHEAWQAEQAVIVLAAARRLYWRKWPLRQQVEYLFNQGGPLTAVQAQLGTDCVLLPFYEACILNQPEEVSQRQRKVLLALADQRSELLWRPELCQALAAIGKHYPQRRRELADWKPRSRNPFRQLESLVRHLFDQYGDVPAWVLNSWMAGRLYEGIDIPRLTLHLGQGLALRKFQGLPLTLTRKLEHHLRQAPANCTFLEALRYAQLADRNALSWLGPVLDSRLGREIGRDDSFWLTVVDFFRAAPAVDRWRFGPVCDWIHQKRSVGLPLEPPQPGFTLKGRSMASVLHQTEQWHRQVARLPPIPEEGVDITAATTWEPLAVADFNGGGPGKVQITQLRTYRDLLREGWAQRHCVSTYVQACVRGRCGIFSLTVGGVRALTLEVLANRTIVQARGVFNRRMNDEELSWVQRWANENRLLVPKHLY
ncbi:hypothetical protein FY528_01275 [Hymenobacter lutimineralis]|uniref:PcfJ-like protein n=1 Tax=Hymenobacter lutimineralis TaxID=2606448 RepID=A0A5D6VHX2_9BACT|nr:PcfJ domain-containing protein [Hymenobacter lutimineralis]TYZ14389.1 hypothetical protein FY528_01275 [Hymenobacter lutimineralis]